MTDTHDAPVETNAKPTESNLRTGLIVLAALWAVTAIIVAIVLMATTTNRTYGADAYTGIQNAIVAAVQGISWLLIGSGILGLIVAIRRN